MRRRTHGAARLKQQTLDEVEPFQMGNHVGTRDHCAGWTRGRMARQKVYVEDARRPSATGHRSCDSQTSPRSH